MSWQLRDLGRGAYRKIRTSGRNRGSGARFDTVLSRWAAVTPRRKALYFECLRERGYG